MYSRPVPPRLLDEEGGHSVEVVVVVALVALVALGAWRSLGDATAREAVCAALAIGGGAAGDCGGAGGGARASSGVAALEGDARDAAGRRDALDGDAAGQRNALDGDAAGRRDALGAAAAGRHDALGGDPLGGDALAGDALASRVTARAAADPRAGALDGSSFAGSAASLERGAADTATDPGERGGRIADDGAAGGSAGALHARAPRAPAPSGVDAIAPSAPSAPSGAAALDHASGAASDAADAEDHDEDGGGGCGWNPICHVTHAASFAWDHTEGVRDAVAGVAGWGAGFAQRLTWMAGVPIVLPGQMDDYVAFRANMWRGVPEWIGGTVKGLWTVGSFLVMRQVHAFEALAHGDVGSFVETQLGVDSGAQRAERVARRARGGDGALAPGRHVRDGDPADAGGAWASCSGSMSRRSSCRARSP